MNKERFNKLVRHIRNEQAADELYSFYFPAIVRHINRVYRGMVDGQDIAQEVFIKLLDGKVKTYINYPTSYIYKIADNTTNEALKKNNKRMTAEQCSAADEVTYIKENATDIFKYLPDELVELVYLYYFEHYTFKEISDILKVKENTLKTRHRRAKKILKNTYYKDVL